MVKKIEHELFWCEEISKLNDLHDCDKKFREAVLSFCYDENVAWNKRLRQADKSFELPSAIKAYLEED
jgi:hypothetical protein